MLSLSPAARLIRDAYFEYLSNQSKNRPENMLSASMVGGCFLKHRFRMQGTEKDSLNEKSLARLRLGDLIHNDVQNAVKECGLPMLMELRMIDKDLNLSGHTDFIYIEDEMRFMSVIDLKTIGAYPWSKKFGHKKNRRDDGDDRYELQLGTYAYLFNKKFGMDIAGMSLLYVKVDDPSIWREVQVPLTYIDRAVEYWKETNKLLKSGAELTPGETWGVPFMSWECGYCPYKSKCNTPYG